MDRAWERTKEKMTKALDRVEPTTGLQRPIETNQEDDNMTILDR